LEVRGRVQQLPPAPHLQQETTPPRGMTISRVSPQPASLCAGSKRPALIVGGSTQR